MIISEMKGAFMMLLEVKSVKKVYGRGLNSTTALNNMNLEIEEGEFVAIMGSLAPVNLHCSIS